MKTSGWFAFLIFLSASRAVAGTVYGENIPYQWMTQPYRFTHQVDLRFSPALGKRQGIDYRLSYSLGPSAIDIQVNYLSSKWSALSAPASDNDIAFEDPELILSDPASEVNRARKDSDSWTQWIYELGYSYRGRVIPMDMRNWTQSSRFAVGYTKLKDLTHGLGYSGVTLNTEYTLGYAIKPMVSIGPTVGLRYGWAHLDGVPTSNTTRIPLLSLEMTVGAQFRL